LTKAPTRSLRLSRRGGKSGGARNPGDDRRRQTNKLRQERRELSSVAPPDQDKGSANGGDGNSVPPGPLPTAEREEDPRGKGFPTADELAAIEGDWKDSKVLLLHGPKVPRAFFRHLLADVVEVFSSVTSVVEWMDDSLRVGPEIYPRAKLPVAAVRALTSELRKQKSSFARVVLMMRDEGPAWLELHRAQAELDLMESNEHLQSGAEGTNERRGRGIDEVLRSPFVRLRMKENYAPEHLDHLARVLEEIARQTLDTSQHRIPGRILPAQHGIVTRRMQEQGAAVLYGPAAAAYAAAYESAEAIVMEREEEPGLTASVDRVIVLPRDPPLWGRMRTAVTETSGRRVEVGKNLEQLRSRIPQNLHDVVLFFHPQPRHWEVDTADLLLAAEKEPGGAFFVRLLEETGRLTWVFQQLTTGEGALERMRRYGAKHVSEEAQKIEAWITREYEQAQKD
jgi:hypothetical protein